MIQLPYDYFHDLTTAKITALFDLSQPKIKHRQALHQRYNRKPSGNIDMMMSGSSGNILMPIERYIIHMADGAFSGIDPQYNSNNEELQDALDMMLRINSNTSKFTKTMKRFNITSASHYLAYEDKDNQFKYVQLPKETIIIYDYDIEPNEIAGLIFSTEKNSEGKDISVVEVFEKNRRRKFNEKGEPVQFIDYINGVGTQTYEKELGWQELPIISFEEEDAIGIFEPVLPLIDAIENMAKNAISMTDYNDNAKLILKRIGLSTIDTHISDDAGFIRPNPAYQQEIQQLYEALALVINDSEGDIKWLIKDVSYNGMIDFMRHLLSLILMLSMTPDLQDKNFGGAQSGRAMRYHMFATEQLGATIFGIMENGYRKLIRLWCSGMNLRGHDFDWRDVTIKFTSNMPQDDIEKARIITEGLRMNAVSHESAVRLYSQLIDLDASAEVERVLAEIDEMRMPQPQTINRGTEEQNIQQENK